MNDPNENRTGYKKTKVGWIPKVWKPGHVRDTGRVVTGSTPSTENPLNYDGPFLFASPSDLGVLRCVRATQTTLTQQGFDTCRKLPARSVLFVCIGSTIGKVGLSGSALATNQQINAIISNNENSPEYLYYILSYRSRYIASTAACQAVPIINKTEFEGVSLPLPPLPEQQKIAEILSTWDDAIEQTGALIESKRQQKKALMQQLLTGHRRLPGFDESRITERLRTHITESTRRCKTRTDLPILSVTNDRGFVSQDEQFGRRVASTDVSNYKVVKEGEFAYNPSRVNVGSLDMLRDIEAGLLSPMYVVFSVKETTLDAKYLRHFCDTYSFAEQVRHLTQGSVRDSLSFDGLAAIKCLIPSLHEQRAIAAVLDTADKEITSLEAKLEALRQQKKGLMQRLLTGQVRVKTA